MTDQSNLVEPEGVNAPGGGSTSDTGDTGAPTDAVGPAGTDAGDARAGGSPEHAGDDGANEMHPSPLGGAPWQDPDAPDGTPSGDR